MKKRTHADTKTPKYVDIDMHTRKDAKRDLTLDLEFSDSDFELGLSESDFQTRTL